MIQMPFLRFFALIYCLFSLSTHAQDDGINVRMMTNEDGSRTVFKKLGDQRLLVKRNFSADGVLRMVTVYRMNRKGDPMSSEIRDAKGNDLFWVRYGYDKKTGKLVEEQMFDARIKRIDKEKGKEMPVRRFIYVFNAQGKKEAPISLTLIPGKTADEAFGIGTTGDIAPELNPFKN